MNARRHTALSLSLSAALALACAGAPRAAHADPLTAQDEANARFQTGLKYYDARDFESARLAFTQAYAVLQKPSILLNLALSELYADRPLDALVHLETFLRDGAPTPDKRERAQKAMDEAFKKTGHLAIKAPAGASLRVDDKSVATPTPAAPLVHVSPGRHVVGATLGDKAKSVTVDARAGEATSLEIAFEGDASTSAIGPQAAPASSAHVDGPPPEPERTTFWGWRSIGGLTLVGLGAVGLGVAFAAKSSESDARDRAASIGGALPPDACSRSTSAQCTDLATAIDERDAASSRATTFFVVGGVAAGAGIALVASAILWPHRRDASPRARVMPMSGPKQAGLVFRADFH